MTTEVIDTVEAQERVDAILKPDSPEERAMQKWGKAMSEFEQKPAPNRKPRSDKGVPRDSFYVSIPGVRFDLNHDTGRVAFIEFLSRCVEEKKIESVIGFVVELFREIDRLRSKTS